MGGYKIVYRLTSRFLLTWFSVLSEFEHCLFTIAMTASKFEIPVKYQFPSITISLWKYKVKKVTERYIKQ